MRLRTDPRALYRNARSRVKRLARRTAAVRYRSVVVPLLGRAETEHAVDLACRLAADRGARVILVAPLVVEPELPLTAHLDEEKAALQVRLDEAAAIAESYGVGATKRLVITRERALGLELASVAREYRAELIVVGSPVESRRGFRRAFPSEVFSVLREAPCRVMVATGPVAGRSRPAA
jgi:nucleotide-binding universal stress UspA family protein